MRPVGSKLLRVILAGVIAVDPNRVHWYRLAAQEPAPATSLPAKTSPQQRQLQAEEMERRLRTLEAAQHEIPRESFDLQAIVDKVGRDPNKLFAWVRDQTYWVPYQGALRGPIGVLMDRLGNSLDRAYLLAELVRLAGQDVRLAQAELTEAQARQLLTQLRPVPEVMPAMVPAPTHEAALKRVAKYAKEFQLDGVAIRKNLEKDWQAATKIKEELSRRLTDQVPRVAQAVGKPTEKAADTGAMQALRDHWWVQWRDHGAWVELDPLLPETPPGRVTGQAQASLTLAPKEGKLLLAGKLCHEVHLRVIVERWQAGKLKEETVLQHTLRPYQLFQDRIILRHMPLGWPDDLDLLHKQEQQRLQKAVLERHEWLPILSIGTSHRAQASFTDTGEIHQDARQIFSGELTKAIGGLDPFKAFPQPGNNSSPKENGELTAEWIEYDIYSPGKPVCTIRRQIFDLLGPAAREEKKVLVTPIGEKHRLERGLNLLGETEILLLAGQLSPDYVEHLVATRRLANQQVWPELLRKGVEASGKEVQDALGKFVPLPGHLHSLALIRGQWSAPSNEAFLDHPNILTYHSRLHLDLDGQIHLQRGLDIVHNEIAAASGSTRDQFLVRLKQGILDTNIEALLLASPGPVENTAELFLPKVGAERWLTLRQNKEVDEQAPQLPNDVRARIRQDLASGHVVIVAPKGVVREGRTHYGWWRVDPKTGSTLGMGEYGWGQSGTERSLGEVFAIGFIVICVIGIAWYRLPDPQSLWDSIVGDIIGRGTQQIGGGNH